MADFLSGFGKQALKKQGKKLSGDKASAEHLRAVKGKIDVYATEEMLQVGLDLPGQCNAGWGRLGGGLNVEIGIDPGKVIGLAAEVTVGVGGETTKDTLIVASVNSKQPGGVDIPETTGAPNGQIALVSMRGRRWQGEAKAGVFIGVSWKASAGVSGTGGDSGTESSFDDDDGGDDSILDTELLGASFEAKAGLEASLGGKCEYMYLVDPAPRFHKDGQSAREALRRTLQAGGTKALVKTAACDFINKYSSNFGKISYKGTFGGHASSAKILKALRKGIETTYANAPGGTTGLDMNAHRVIDEAYDHIRAIVPFAEKLEATDDFLSLTAPEVSTSASLGGSVEGKVSSPVAGVSGSAGLALLKGETKHRWLWYRYQRSAAPNGRVLATDDTRVGYHLLTGKIGEVSGSLSSSLGTKSKKVEGDKALAEATVQRLSYESTVVFWQRPTDGSGKTRALPGSGQRFGTSLSMPGLMAFYKKPTGKSSNALIERLAANLRVTPQTLRDFLNDRMLKDTAESVASDDKLTGVVLESTWALQSTNCMVDVDDKGNLTKKLGNALKSQSFGDAPESLRLRYRKSDEIDQGWKFKIGFAAVAVDWGIEFVRVNRLGSFGVVDLHTHWTDSTKNGLRHPGQAYDGAVPGTALFYL